MEFSARQVRSLARLTAYALLAVFLISVAAAIVPPPVNDPSRALAVLGEVLERSTLPLVALALLHAGFAGAAAPALWEAHLAGAIRPLLRLAALLYLLVALVLPPLGFRGESLGAPRLHTELDARLDALAALSAAVEQAPDAGGLRDVLRRDPQLVGELERQGGGFDQASSLPGQRNLALRLLERARANLRSEHLARRADASGNLVRQILRLSLTALVYALYHAVAGLVWPASVPRLRLRVLERISREREEEDGAATEPDSGGEGIHDR